MNIALCFHGQPRFIEESYQITWKKIIDQFNPDIYIHTWWDIDTVGTLYPASEWAKPGLNHNDLLVKPDTIQKMLDLYSPYRYLVESPIKHELKGKPTNYYQYYTQYKAKELVNKKYDIIIRARFDLKILQDIPVIQSDELLVPNTCPNPTLLNDAFSISNQKNFNKISDTYLNLEEFISNGIGEREYAFKAQIDKEQIPYKRFEATYSTFDVMRSYDI